MNKRSACLCEVCGQGAAKYKCPTCTAAYCSVPCYKRHKETPCSSHNPKVDEIQPNCSTAALDEGIPLQEDDEELIVTREQFERVVSNAEICDLLKSSSVRQVIRQIDGSAEPEKLLDAARAESNRDPTAIEFRRLVDVLLDTVKPEYG